MTHIAYPTTWSTTAIVMNKQEKQDKRKLSRNHSRNRTKSASKTRHPLTSRDVYYMVVKYEQERLVKKAIENQARFYPYRESRMEDDFHETKKDTATSRRGSKLSINSKEREENDAGYTDDFEDERDCAVQSAMTSHSEHLKEEDVEKTEEIHENEEETPRLLEDATKNDNGDRSNETQSEAVDKEKEESSDGTEEPNNQDILKETEAVREQNDQSPQIIDNSLKGGNDQDNDDDGDDDNEGKENDLIRNDKTSFHVQNDNAENDDTLQRSNTDDLKTGQKTGSNGGNDDSIINEDPQGKDEDSQGNQLTNDIGENDDGMAYEDNKDNKQCDPKSKKNSDAENENREESKIEPNSEEERLSRYEGSEVSLHSYDRHSRRSTKYSPSTDSHSNYDEQLSVDYSESEASTYHKKSRSKPLKKVVLAGLPPRKPLTILATKGDPKRNYVNREMKRVVQEILIRGDKKIKDLTTQAQSLRRTTEVLSEENKAMKKLHKIQSREIQKIDDFVSMTTSRSKVVKKDVRNSEMTSVDMNINVRKQVKEILLLRQECERYEKLVEMDRKMPRRSVLKERLEKVERQLESKDKELENMNKKVLAQQKRISQERQKENKKFAQLDEEIHGTIQECQELKIRLKEAERKIDKTNIYSRRSNATKSLPPSTSLPALTWHPPVHREKTRTKVKKWLNDSNNKHR